MRPRLRLAVLDHSPPRYGRSIDGASNSVAAAIAGVHDVVVIEFSVLDPLNQEELDAWIDVVNDSMLADAPDFPSNPPVHRAVSLLRRSSFVTIEHVLAKRDGQVVAAVELYMPQKDNLHHLELELEVHPDHRRTGVGTALLAEVERRAAEYGRSSLVTYVATQLEGGPPRPDASRRFAEAHGYTASLDEIYSRLDLAEVDPANLDTLWTNAWEKAADYELVQWVNETPDDLAAGVAYLEGRLNTDAPTGNLDVEKANVDAQRIRDKDRNRSRSGQTVFHSVLRHRASRYASGWTELVVNPGDELNAWQGITLVDPDHRGHRLGMILKIANLRLLGEYRPKVRQIHTWNAEENSRMIAINRAVGFTPVNRAVAFQKKLATNG